SHVNRTVCLFSTIPLSYRPLHFTPLHQTPTHTLFPYTTLFRSHRRCRSGKHSTSRDPALQWARLQVRVPRELQDQPRGSCRRCGDRKSTRLNSSHRTISYAVFCLKKKKDVEISVMR